MANPHSVALLLSEEDIQKLIKAYPHLTKERIDPLLLHLHQGDGFSLMIYKKSHQGSHKVLFQGEKADLEARRWKDLDRTSKNGLFSPLFDFRPDPKEASCPFPQIGSDEVGTGDFFGPVCVVASFVEEKDLGRLSDLGVTDSKKMEDSHILEIGPALVKEFPYSSLSLSPLQYNALYKKGENLNSIKAKMHNRCLLNLKSSFPFSHPCMDQFAEEGLYYSYLKGEKEVLEGIAFSTKGELAFPSVALASVLARYSFLRKMGKMREEYGFPFPLGASSLVQEAGKEFARIHGEKELEKVAKMNFKTVEKILG